MLASLSFSGFFLSISLLFTNAECKYRLCGIITAPMTPTACNSTSESQSLHIGIKRPFVTSTESGPEITYSYPKETPMVAINMQKSISNLRRPYLSKNKNVNVSNIVIKHPPQRGTLKQIKFNI